MKISDVFAYGLGLSGDPEIAHPWNRKQEVTI